jgi:alkylation response protein AidB-like acyl-CoA dehydrogenase
MKTILSPEQVDFQHSLRRLLESEWPVASVRGRKDDPAMNIDSLWMTLAKNGVFGLHVSPDLGGQGGDLLDVGLFCQEAGRVLCPSVVYSSIGLGVALDRLGQASATKPLAERLMSGELRGTAVVASADDASDVAPRLAVAQRDGTMRLGGTLQFVPDALEADVLLVVARDELGKLLTVCLDPARQGVIRDPLRTLGNEPQCHVTFDDVEVRDTDLVSSADGVSADDLLQVSNALLALQCMEMVGGAQAVLDRTVDYAKGRHQFGRAIASFQAAQHHISNMRIAIDGARLTAHQAMWHAAQGAIAEREVAIAKLMANEAYKWATLTAHQLHGGMGYLRETDLPFWSERAKLTELMGGARETQIHRLERVMRSTPATSREDKP